jgi:hypothetical protein
MPKLTFPQYLPWDMITASYPRCNLASKTPGEVPPHPSSFLQITRAGIDLRGEKDGPTVTRLRFSLPLGLLALGLSWSAWSAAQQPSQPAQIVAPIDESQLVTLTGNTPPAAAISGNDRGPVSPAMPMTDLVLVLKRSAAQQAAFDAFVASQYTPSSPNFHRWLTSAEVGATYGPPAADIATISGWLGSKGFLVNAVAPDGMTIRFSGTAAQVESAFHTQIENVMAGGVLHIANLSDPQIPAALAPVVAGIKALHNFFPRPQHRLGGMARLNAATGRWQRMDATPAIGPVNSTEGGRTATPAGEAEPFFGYTVDSTTLEDVAPYDFATIYNVLPAWNENIDGTGQTIAIAGTSDIDLSDVATFRSVFGLPAGTPPTIVVANGTDPGECTSTAQDAPCGIGDLIENSLDVEWSGAVAKGANIVLVVSGANSATTDTVYSSAQYVVENNTAKILNVSYGECELGMGTSGNAAYNDLWETAATEGISVFVAAGDSGAATCDQDQSSSTPYAAHYGLTVSGMASTPYDTAVGGTDLNWGSTPAPYWGSSDNASNESNALNYIPEVPWNDTCTNPLALNYLQEWAAELIKNGYSATTPTDAESACNFVEQEWDVIYTHTNPAVNISGFVDTVGGGGGASNCTSSNQSTVASCTGGYTKPAWQTGVSGIPSDGKRDLPDVSFFAGNGFLGSASLICVSAVGACSYTSAAEPVGEEVGGTSVASPAMAGVMALIDQKAGSPQGNAGPELYALALRQNYGNCSSETGKTNNGCLFNDVDSGTNAMPCNSGSPDCTVNSSSDTIGVLSGYSATTGYDPASGLGSLNVANVVNAWNSSLGTATATVTVTPSSGALPLSQSLSVSVAVSGASGTPTGTVSLTSGSYVAAVGTLVNGAYTFTIPADSLTAGSDTLSVSYSGDGTYASATGTASVTISKIAPSLAVQANPTQIGANTNGDSVTVTATGAGPTPTGSVTFSVNSYTSPACTLVSGSCTAVVPTSAFTNGTDTITANYSGDQDYTSGSASTTVSVTILTPTLQLTPSTTTLTTAQSMQLTATVTGSGPTPTGFVNIFGLYQIYGTGGALSNGSYTFNISPNQLAPTTDTLTVQYGGDSTYTSASAATSVTVSLAAATISATPSATSIETNAALTISGTISVSGGTPNGNVIVSGGGYTGTAGVYGGQYSLVIPPGSLSAGNIVLSVQYNGGEFYLPASTSITVAVTQFVKIAPSLTITAASTSIDAGQQFDVTVAVAGSDGQPTGSVTLTSGSYSSGAWPISGGSTTVVFPANTLSVGTDTINVSYSGDATYLAATGTTSITVAASSYTLTASTAPSIAPGGLTQSTITIGTSTGYSGTITATCALTGQPSGAIDLPTCIMVNNTVELSGNNAQMGFVDVNVNTTAATAELARPDLRGRKGQWGGAAGAVLALILFFGIPARRRSWRSVLGVLILLVVLGGLGACGGGGSAGGGGGGNAGTTAGTYTFTVTATGNPAVTPTPTVTFTVTVN